jgi:hypothetical protein
MPEARKKWSIFGDFFVRRKRFYLNTYLTTNFPSSYIGNTFAPSIVRQ